MKILDEETLARYQRFAKLWWAGWVLAAAALLGASFAWARVVEQRASYEAVIVDLHVLTDNVDRLRANNDQTIGDISRLQQSQDASIAAILDVGQYLQARQDQMHYNRRAVVDLTKKGRSRWQAMHAH